MGNCIQKICKRKIIQRIPKILQFLYNGYKNCKCFTLFGLAGCKHYTLHCARAVSNDIFVPRCQLRKCSISHFCTWKMFQQIIQIFIDVQVMGFRHLYHCVNGCTCLCPLRHITEHPVFSSQCKRTDCILAQIIRKTASAIFQISHGQFFMILGIVHRFLKACPFLGSLL